ncbi:MAG: tetratricopeptide repeat protein [Zoogloeaceae bacterium]|nr:tetratricopeptide repeat protein [Zoogloeaceae bacterium]
MAKSGLTGDPRNPHLLMILSEAHRCRGEIDAALDTLRRLLVVQPGNVEALANLGGLLVDTGKNEEAIVVLEKAVRLRPGFAEAENNLGTALTNQGRNEEGLGHFQKALDANPASVDTLDNLANTYAILGRIDEALAAYLKSVEILPMRLTTLVRCGDLCYSAGRIDEALACYNKALQLKPDAADALAGLGMISHDLGQLDRARDCLARASAVAPQRADIMIWLGSVLADMNKTAEALECAARARALLPEAGSIDFDLGKLFAAAGEPDSAEFFLGRYQTFDPTDKKGAAFVLASLGQQKTPLRTEAGFLRSYYDAARAEGWDSIRHNRPPELVASMAVSLISERSQTVALDLGCGTGRVGESLGSRVAAIDGVDFSPEMLRKARSKGCYRHLYEEDMIDCLARRNASYDLVVAAAAFIYFSDLKQVLSSVARSLRDAGLVVFTLLKGNPEVDTAIAAYHGHVMDACFCHSPEYVRRVALECGFEVLRLDEDIHEYNRVMLPIPALVVALRRIL